ncbi:MAG: lysophospholipid acyltransferase family protein [Rhodothermales bacterium]|nr:lysophospholipid acyltransferase family protein [Rhodothermales bacterium]
MTGGDRPDSGCLIVSNHLGMIDPFVIGGTFRVVFSAKAEMLHWPVAGWVCRTIDLIPVYRGRRSRTGEFAAAVAERLRSGLNVLAFPEGTTSGGTDILPFKTGAFAAVESLDDGLVLPVTLRVTKIDGRAPDSHAHALFTWADTSKPLISHFWQLLGITSAVVEIDVAAPINTAGRSRKELADTAYEIIRASSSAQKLEKGELTT